MLSKDPRKNKFFHVWSCLGCRPVIHQKLTALIWMRMREKGRDRGWTRVIFVMGMQIGVIFHTPTTASRAVITITITIGWPVCQAQLTFSKEIFQRFSFRSLTACCWVWQRGECCVQMVELVLGEAQPGLLDGHELRLGLKILLGSDQVLP